jgi:hypothetical protein
VSQVKIVVDQPGATIFVDDEQVGTSPLVSPVMVDIGSHRVRATKNGFVEATETALISGGETTRDVQIHLDAAATDGHLAVNAGPVDVIELDGNRVGVGRWEGAVPAGTHSLRVSAPEKKTYLRDVLLKKGESRDLAVTLERETKGPPLWVWIGGGAVLVAAGGITAALLAAHGGGSAQTDPPKPVAQGTLPPGVVYLPGMP